MDIRALKEYIFQNNHIQAILQDLGCHHIKFHSTHWTCGNPDGDNKSSVNIKNDETLFCTNWTRNISNKNWNDLIDLIMFYKQTDIVEALKFICETANIDYYYDFEDDIPESIKITKAILEMNNDGNINEDDKPLKPIPQKILTYYKPYVNDMFFNDGIDYETQREFEVGYDEETNRITIPIFSEINDLVGVKGRLFSETVEEYELKYLYLEPVSRSKVLFGLNKTMEYIKSKGFVYIVESEKAVMQLWSMGVKNSVATGGKKVSRQQIEMLTRLGVNIVLTFDKDVSKLEIEELANRFIDNIPVYYIFDEGNILEERQSPTDSKDKWTLLSKNNVYKIR